MLVYVARISINWRRSALRCAPAHALARIASEPGFLAPRSPQRKARRKRRVGVFAQGPQRALADVQPHNRAICTNQQAPPNGVAHQRARQS